MSNENNNQNNQFEQPQVNNGQYYQTSPQQPPQGYYNQQMPNMPSVPAPEEKASVGLAILSYLIPLVGLILYLTKKDTRPKTAKVCGKCALASFIINIVLTVILYAIMGAAMFGGLTDDNGGNADSSYSEQADENSVTADSQKTNSGTTVGDYGCVVKGAEMAKNYDGKDAIIITYEFTNNSDSAQSFDVALSDELYQNGVGLETAIFIDDAETDGFDVKIQPGVTKEVRKGYILQDTSTPIEVEISELFSLTDDKIVTTVELPN